MVGGTKFSSSAFVPMCITIWKNISKNLQTLSNKPINSLAVESDGTISEHKKFSLEI